jgi:hypothetical protein
LKRELSLVVGSKGRGSAGEGGGFVAPDVVEELAVQLFYPLFVKREKYAT